MCVCVLHKILRKYYVCCISSLDLELCLLDDTLKTV